MKYLVGKQASCGAGKTHKLIQMINGSTDTTKFLVVQNTIKLMEQTHAQIPNSKLICSTSGNVADRVIEYLKNPGKCLIISDKAFDQINPNSLKDYAIFLDDVTTCAQFKIINEANVDIKRIIYDDIFENHQDCKKDDSFITASKKDLEGDLIKALAEPFSIIENYDCFIMNKDWFFDPKFKGKNENNGTVITSNKIQLGILAYKDMDKYKNLDITYLANNFTDSLIYLAHSEFFEPVTWEGLRTRTVPIETRLNVYYFSKKELSSTYKMQNPDEMKKIYKYLDSQLSADEYYWTNNNSDLDMLKGEKISPDARGINSLQSYTKCIWLACMRPSPIECKMMHALFGISSEQIVKARERENLGQFVQRGIIRQFSSTEVQTVYVFSESQALSLSTKVEHIDLGIDDAAPKIVGRPVKAEKITGALNSKLKRVLAKNPSIEQFKIWADAQECTSNERDELWSRFDKRIKKRKLAA